MNMTRKTIKPCELNCIFNYKHESCHFGIPLLLRLVFSHRRDFLKCFLYFSLFFGLHQRFGLLLLFLSLFVRNFSPEILQIANSKVGRWLVQHFIGTLLEPHIRHVKYILLL